MTLHLEEINLSQEEISMFWILINVSVTIPLVVSVVQAESLHSGLFIDVYIKVFNHMVYFESLTTYAAFKRHDQSPRRLPHQKHTFTLTMYFLMAFIRTSK